MAAERKAETTWRGDLMSGSGTIHEAPSGAFGPLEVSWAARTEEPGGKTSPEELIAAAHSACFAMALSLGLAKAGIAARGAADVLDDHLRPRRPGSRRPRSRSRGACPGIDEDAFRAAAEDAKVNCPVSKALAAVPEITLDARLAG